MDLGLVDGLHAAHAGGRVGGAEAREPPLVVLAYLNKKSNMGGKRTAGGSGQHRASTNGADQPSFEKIGHRPALVWSGPAGSNLLGKNRPGSPLCRYTWQKSVSTGCVHQGLRNSPNVHSLMLSVSSSRSYNGPTVPCGTVSKTRKAGTLIRLEKERAAVESPACIAPSLLLIPLS